MIRGDVGYDCDVCLEVIYVVELETAELQYVDVMLLCRYLIGVALSYVSSQSDVESCLFEQVVDE